MAQHQEQLARMLASGCEAPGCDHSSHAHGPLFLHARCHLSAGLEVSIEGDGKILKVACRKCHKLVAEIAVASEVQYAALVRIARGDYDNAHDCTAAARIAAEVLAEIK